MELKMPEAHQAKTRLTLRERFHVEQPADRGAETACQHEPVIHLIPSYRLSSPSFTAVCVHCRQELEAQWTLKP